MAKRTGGGDEEGDGDGLRCGIVHDLAGGAKAARGGGGAKRRGAAIDFCFKVCRSDDFGGEVLREVKGECVLQAAGGRAGKKTVVGSLNGSLLLRGMQPSREFSHGFFHSMCDDLSEELQEISTKMCNSDGTLRHANIDGLNEVDASWASIHGFFHLENVEVDEAYRHRDLGVRFVRSLLEWLNADKQTQWTLATLNAGAATSEDDEHRKVLVQFARLGFRQQAFGSSLWYLVPCRLTLVPKADAAKIAISCMPEAPEVQEKDEPLMIFLSKLYKTKAPADFGAELDRLCAAGANVARALALHHAMAMGVQMSPADIGHFVRHKADVNAQDHSGNTPLHFVGGAWAYGLDPDQTRALLGAGGRSDKFVSSEQRRSSRSSSAPH